MATASSTQKSLFNVQGSLKFKWSDMPFFIRDYYNYMLGIVFSKDKALMKNIDFKYFMIVLIF